MKIKKNLIGVIMMLVAVAIAAAAGHLPGSTSGGGRLAEAAGAPATAQDFHMPAPITQTPEASAPATPAPAPTFDLDAAVKQFEDAAGGYFDEKGFSSNRYAYTDKELRALATVIHLESRNQPYECMLAVGNVVMNRVLAPGFPGKTILSVVSSPNQFCYDPKVTPNAKSMQAARDVLEYEVWTVPQNTYFFRANKSTANWYKHIYWKHLGNTAFYLDKYSGRSNGGAIPPRLYERKFRWPQYGCEPGGRVTKLQTMLVALGYDVETDGYFGKSTEKAVKDFQAAEGLKADGIAGPETLRALIGRGVLPPADTIPR
jgi:hypothetical protein